MLMTHGSTLRASQLLNADFTASSELGRDLLERLNGWYSSLPETFRLPNWSKSVNGLAPYPTSIHFAYLLLVVYVYRAMLRPMARSSEPPLIFDLEDMTTTSPLPVDESILDFSDLPEIESLPEISISDEFGTGEATLHAAEKCASILVNFTRRLTSSDFTAFWYSCKLFSESHIPHLRKLTKSGSRIGFATISNYLMLLLVQAPNISHAIRGRHLVDSWLQVLRCQSQSFPLVKLGLARLDALHWAGLGNTFVLPLHVQEAIVSPDVPAV